MRIYTKEKNIIIEDVKDFSIGQTLECGQCFNFDKLDEEEYALTAYGHFLHVSQKGDKIILHDTDEKLVDLWVRYLDLERDYGIIKKRLIERAPELKEAIDGMWGVRIMNQEFSETLMSFIISQNKRIKHIKDIVHMISERYGTYLAELNGKSYYAFPTVDALYDMGREGFRECKTGFRAPYLEDAADKMKNGLNAASFEGLTYHKGEAELKKIRGVGSKVANCVMLFSLGYRSAFPVDVWIKKIMEEMYFHKDTKIEEISAFASDRFGEDGGIAQQYLFSYNISKNKQERE